MGNQPNQKLKLLYLMEIMLKKTDAQSGLAMHEVLGELAARGIDADRKSVGRDFGVLREFGLDVVFDTSTRRWRLEERPFSAEELVMLVDAVQSAPFLTEAMAVSLIKKLQGFASESQEERLLQRLDLDEYVKMNNPQVFWNIDAIQQASYEGKKVRFRYFHLDANGNRVLNHDGKIYELTPLRLVFARELYYLLAYHERYDGMTPYRVDRMVDVEVSDQPAVRNQTTATWQLKDQLRLSFGVFGDTELEPVVLEMEERLVSVARDKFGDDMDVYPAGEGKAKVYAKAPLTPQFYGWLLQMGSEVRILSPSKAVEQYKTYLTDALKPYE